MRTHRGFGRRLIAMSLGAAALWALAPGCGGGGGGGGGGAAPATTTISGAAVKGPISGASVDVIALNADGTLGEALGSGTTDASGAFSVSVATPTGSIAVRITGNATASFRDEATGATVPFTASDSLLVYVPGPFGASVTVNVTPLTHYAALRIQQIAATSTTALATLITQTNGSVAAQFSVSDILTVTPANLTDGTPDDPAAAATTYGLVLAALSQEAETLAAGGQAVDALDLVQAMAVDFQTDELFNGVQSDGATISLGTATLSPTAATADLSDAIGSFVASPQNTSGVDATEAATLVGAVDSVLGGQVLNATPLPAVTSVTFTAKSGDTVTEEVAFGGWVSLVVVPTTAPSIVTTAIGAAGGSVVESIPGVGSYVASVTPGQEAAFLTAMFSNSFVVSGWPASPLVPALQVAIDEFGPRTSNPACADAKHGQQVAALMKRGSVDDLLELEYTKNMCGGISGPILQTLVGRCQVGTLPDATRRLVEAVEAGTARSENVVVNMSLQSSESHRGDFQKVRTTCMFSNTANAAPCKEVQAAQKHFLESILNDLRALSPEARQRVAVVVAAGNAGVDLAPVLADLQARYPEEFKGLRIVGATFDNGTVDQRMNYAASRMTFAMGNNVVWRADCPPLVGTSFAAPEVARVIAQIWKAYPKLTADQVQAALDQALADPACGNPSNPNVVPFDAATGQTTQAFIDCAKRKALALVTYTLTVAATGPGTVAALPTGPTYPPGTSVTLTATPTGNATFTGWGGACSGTGSCTVVMDADQSVAATFEGVVEPCGITTNSGGQGVTTTSHELGPTPGLVSVIYDSYSIPDQFDIYYNGTLVASTGGVVSGSGTLTFNYPATPSTRIQVTATGPDSGTAWDYTVNCPQ